MLPGEEYVFSWYTIFIALAIGMVVGLRNYMRGPQCISQETLEKKIAIITGANTGIGLEIARDLAMRGARVILACKDEAKGKAAVAEVSEYAKSKRVRFIKLDLSSFQSIRDFVEEFKSTNKSLHYLVNNAAVMYHPEGSSADGYEIHFAINYLGHFLLTYLLLDMMKSSAPGRVVNFSCPAYQLAELDLDALAEGEMPTSAPDGFANSKLATMLFTRSLARRLEGSNITANVVHPGICNSGIYRNMPFMKSKVIKYTFSPILWFVMKGVRDGAQTPIQCLVAKDEESVSGKFYVDLRLKEPEAKATDDDMAERLWTISEKLVGLKEGSLTGGVDS